MDNSVGPSEKVYEGNEIDHFFQVKQARSEEDKTYSLRWNYDTDRSVASVGVRIDGSRDSRWMVCREKKVYWTIQKSIRWSVKVGGTRAILSNENYHNCGIILSSLSILHEGKKDMWIYTNQDGAVIFGCCVRGAIFESRWLVVCIPAETDDFIFGLSKRHVAATSSYCSASK